ncbi:MAG: CDP-alcohol phosphatidyltransferase family protein [Sciscionella sp.]
MTGIGTSGTGFAAALRELPALQKSAKGAPAYSRFVNRRAGRYLAAAACQIGATPNQVTAVSAVFTFAGIVAIAALPPSVPLGILVCLALLVGYALDSADGQLARLRGGGTKSGEWLDHIVDSAKISALHLAVLISGYRFFDLPKGYLLVPIGFTVVAAVMFFAMTLNEALRRMHRATTAAASAEPAEPARHSTMRSLLVVPTDYGLLCISFVLLGFATVFASVYGLLFLANLTFLVAALRKWFKDMSALDAPSGDNG